MANVLDEWKEVNHLDQNPYEPDPVGGFVISGQEPVWFAEHKASGVIFEVSLRSISGRTKSEWHKEVYSQEGQALQAEAVERLGQLAVKAVQNWEAARSHTWLSKQASAE